MYRRVFRYLVLGGLIAADKPVWVRFPADSTGQLSRSSRGGSIIPSLHRMVEADKERRGLLRPFRVLPLEESAFCVVI